MGNEDTVGILVHSNIVGHLLHLSGLTCDAGPDISWNSSPHVNLACQHSLDSCSNADAYLSVFYQESHCASKPACQPSCAAPPLLPSADLSFRNPIHLVI